MMLIAGVRSTGFLHLMRKFEKLSDRDKTKTWKKEMIFNTSTYLFTSSYSHVTYTAKEDLLSLFLGFLFTESC